MRLDLAASYSWRTLLEGGDEMAQRFGVEMMMKQVEAAAGRMGGEDPREFSTARVELLS